MSLEIGSVQAAVDDANALAQGPALKLEVFNAGDGEAAATAAAQRVADDPDVLAVVVHGENGVAPGPLAVFEKAHLAVVAASSWAQPRPDRAYATWLSPGLTGLASTAALYAKREGLQQVAVVDDGAATSAAAARTFAARFRALGGKVTVETTWTGEQEDLSATVHSLDVHWPQLVFYAGDAGSAGRLVLAMKGEKALKNADLFGLPPLFDAPFFDTTRIKGMRTRAIFPCPDYDGMGALVRDLGFAFPRTSPQYRAYLHFDFRHPGRWTSMLYDGAALAARAVREASIPAAPASLTPVAQAAGVSASAGTDLRPSPTVDLAVAAAQIPTRDAVRLALDGIAGYKGMRGEVKFNAAREPSESKAMIYFALNRVNRKEMLWKQRAYGPPF
jgi:ABC-type branched-subunit amino acid transport system substrate-binding protein